MLNKHFSVINVVRLSILVETDKLFQYFLVNKVQKNSIYLKQTLPL